MRIFMPLVLLAGLVACSGQPADEGGTADADHAHSTSIENRGSEVNKWWEKLPRREWQAFERVVPDADWYEVHDIGDDIYAIYEPGHFEEIISYLIVGDVKALLFDTGLGLAPIRAVVERLTDKPLTVVNSHSHYDHVGGNHEFDTILALDNPFYNQSSEGLPNAVIGPYVQGDWLPVPPSPDFRAEDYETRPWDISGRIAGGDIIDLGGRALEVIETPGESPDGLSLLDRAHRLLFVGDAFYLGPLYAHLPESDFAAYRQSVDRLAELEPEVDRLLTSHNIPVADAAYLGKLKDAFQAVADDAAPFVETDGAREYKFDGFSILVPGDLD